MFVAHSPERPLVKVVLEQAQTNTRSVKYHEGKVLVDRRVRKPDKSIHSTTHCDRHVYEFSGLAAKNTGNLTHLDKVVEHFKEKSHGQQIVPVDKLVYQGYQHTRNHSLNNVGPGQCPP